MSKSKPKRPRDPNQLAHAVVHEAIDRLEQRSNLPPPSSSGEEEEDTPTKKPSTLKRLYEKAETPIQKASASGKRTRLAAD